jgi:hypothetical protein
LIGVSLNAKSSMSLASSSLAVASWYLGELVFDRARLFLGYLRLQEIADEALRFMLSLQRDGEGPGRHRPATRPRARRRWR